MKLVAFTTHRRQGNLRRPGALARLLRKKNLPTSFASAEQVHGSHLRWVPRLPRSKRYDHVDGLLTTAGNQPLAIFSADCVPLFLAGDRGRVVGLLHAGWRGIQGRILGKAVRFISQSDHVKRGQITAWAGPRIGPCCFAVQWDVARHFPSTRRYLSGQWRVDLAQELARQARRLGIRWLRKKAFEGCTMHEARFFSYRRNGTAQRQVSIIMRREKT